MKTKLLFSFLLSAIILSSVYGQDTTKKKSSFKQLYKWAAGIGAGFTTGYGVSIKYHPKKEGIQLNIFPFIDDHGKRSLICVGLAYTHDVWNGKTNNVYLYFANSLTYNKYHGDNYDYNGDFAYMSASSYPFHNQSSNSTTEKAVYNTGFGLGLEFDTKKRIVINIMIGYAQYDLLKQLAPTGEIALHYKFAKWKK